jgi:hypothetical protein
MGSNVLKIKEAYRVSGRLSRSKYRLKFLIGNLDAVESQENV